MRPPPPRHPQAPTGAHLPPPSTPLSPLVCAVQECKYATRALMSLQVCHCEVGGVAASLCASLSGPSADPPNPLFPYQPPCASTSLCLTFNTQPNIILCPKIKDCPIDNILLTKTLRVKICLCAEVEGLGKCDW